LDGISYGAALRHKKVHVASSLLQHQICTRK